MRRIRRIFTEDMLVHYLDNSATTMVSPAAAAKMTEMMTEKFGNPSSLHSVGVAAERELRTARGIVARILSSSPGEIYFTSGGTEANNLAILGSVPGRFMHPLYRMSEGSAASGNRPVKIIVSDGEHPSVENTVAELGRRGAEIVRIPTPGGKLDMDMLAREADENTALVSVMLVNNETGAVYPVDLIRRILRDKRSPALLHVDAVQAFGKIPFSVDVLGCDLLTISGHKLGAPKGVGALYVRKGSRISPLLFGGGQESGLRSGTENLPAIAAFGVAAAEVAAGLPGKSVRLRELKDYTARKLEATVPGVVIHRPVDPAPNILLISVPGRKSETLMHFLEERDVYVSSGSACNAKKRTPGRALYAFGLSDAEADSALRVSFSFENTQEDADALSSALADAIGNLSKGI